MSNLNNCKMLFCDVRVNNFKIILLFCTFEVKKFEFWHINYYQICKQFMLKYLYIEKFVLSDSKANYTIFPLILNLFLCGIIE